MSDPMIRMLAGLPPAEPDPVRSERIRARCRARLAREAARASRSRVTSLDGRPARIWPSLAGMLGVAYLTEVIGQALRLLRLP